MIKIVKVVPTRDAGFFQDIADGQQVLSVSDYWPAGKDKADGSPRKQDVAKFRTTVGDKDLIIPIGMFLEPHQKGLIDAFIDLGEPESDGSFTTGGLKEEFAVNIADGKFVPVKEKAKPRAKKLQEA